MTIPTNAVLWSSKAGRTRRERIEMTTAPHAPMISNRRGGNSITCHRSSGGCTCQGSSAVKKIDRRLQARRDRQAFRRDLRAGEFA
ncbi:hypothetical protein GADJET_51 [Mycobacterium phage Gadjet]|uniref:Uncharacterized protein n=1 Tax=Mycobacterium phage Gadjet TaxID=1089122 RepID=G8I3T1_9CAUD|nr:hypothetical protein CM02_gp051 [Mycobacterium phage Gadjet]AER47375.1 hypothetical protein GADJET_51 [Mycobacterium phage Gadjet]